MSLAVTIVLNRQRPFTVRVGTAQPAADPKSCFPTAMRSVFSASPAAVQDFLTLGTCKLSRVMTGLCRTGNCISQKSSTPLQAANADTIPELAAGQKAQGFPHFPDETCRRLADTCEPKGTIPT